MLSDNTLLRSQAFIDGKWLDSGEGSFTVTNPANGEALATVCESGPVAAEQAIAAAERAFPKWAALTAGKRSKLLMKWYKLIRENLNDLATLLTLEQGKPIKEAIGEILYGAGFIEWFAEEAKRVYGDTIPGHANDLRLFAIKQPIGVVGAITPWNFPNAMITRKVAPALAAGCTVIIKPAEDTPLSALALAELAERAGFPAGVLNVLPCADPSAVGKALTSSPVVRKISFTGSTETGKLLMRQSADTVKKISLELGGNAPFIVFDDADIEAAAEGAIASKYRNAGQTCICANRILVQRGVYDQFAAIYAARVEALTVGDGMQENSLIGPLINQAAVEKVEALIADALEKGAGKLTGGHVHALGGTFFQPTVLRDATPDMDIFQQEIFGPVAPLYRFEDDNEAIRLANDTRYGLAAYFYARDLGRVWKVAEALEYGMIGINTGMISTPVAPFGGVKESGIGREGSKYGIDEFIEVKYICMNIG